MNREKIKQLKVALLTGGWSDEREISLSSGKACHKALTDAGFTNVDLIDVAEDGFLSRMEQSAYDVAFIAMHGPYGEDGCIQGLLEILHIPYTGSAVLATAIAAEKQIAKDVFRRSNIPTPEEILLIKGDEINPETIIETLGLPLFIKPSSNGSSYGVTKVTEASQMREAVELAWESSEVALVESCIEGMEISVPVIGNQDAFALPIIEIVTGAEFYDLKVKYEPSHLHHVIPARLDEEIYRHAQELAVKAHKALDCRGMSRSDFIIDAEGTPYILETNTIPGMTEASLMPDSARHAGIEFPELCTRFIEMALENTDEDKSE